MTSNKYYQNITTSRTAHDYTAPICTPISIWCSKLYSQCKSTKI